MTWSTANITNVRATVFPMGQSSNGTAMGSPGLILLSWRSSETETLFQVYVNGKLSNITTHPQQRTMLVEHNYTHPAAIEVVAVVTTNKYMDFSQELIGFTSHDGAHAILRWPRRAEIPLGTVACVYWNEGDGEIHYDKPLATQAVWHNPAEKWGWALDSFGKGDFGYSGTGAVGWGKGILGKGEFGFDANEMSFTSESLELGNYKFAVRLIDACGNLDEGMLASVELGVDPLPAAPLLSVVGYDELSDRLILDVG